MTPTLLLADGDTELCDLYLRFFSERGYDVETASDGLECLEKLRRRTPTAVVLDLDLRWGGGDGVLAWLREEGATAGVPVVLTATAGYPVDVAEKIQPPVVRFLPKPFALAALLESVRAAGALKRQAEPCAGKCAAPCPELFLG